MHTHFLCQGNDMEKNNKSLEQLNKATEHGIINLNKKELQEREARPVKASMKINFAIL